MCLKAVAGVVDRLVIDAQVCMTINIRQLKLLVTSSERSSYLPGSTTNAVLSDSLAWSEDIGSPLSAACIGDTTTAIQVGLVAGLEDTLVQLDLSGESEFKFIQVL